MNSGQACIAGTRILVPAGRLAEFEQAIVQAMADYISGDPRDAQTTIGPMVSRKQWQRVQDYIRLGQQEGARLLIGGEGRPQGMEKGWCVKPTVFSDVHNQMRIAREEIFGPVLGIVRAADYDSALELVNSHEFGNGSAVFTSNGHTAREFVHDVQAGMVGVNVPVPVPMAFHSFGGWKRSVFGALNVHGPDGVRFYTRMKTATVRWPAGQQTVSEFSMPTLG